MMLPYKQWRKKEKELDKRQTPKGRLLKDLPAWQISARLAATQKKER